MNPALLYPVAVVMELLLALGLTALAAFVVTHPWIIGAYLVAQQ